MPTVNILILMMYNGELVSQAVEAGALGYLLKNIERDELIRAIRTVYKGNPWFDPSLTQYVLNEYADLIRTGRKSILSDRQREILRLIAAGFSTRDIGNQLLISVTTIKREISNIFNKLGVDSRSQAISEALKRNLI